MAIKSKQGVTAADRMRVLPAPQMQPLSLQDQVVRMIRERDAQVAATRAQNYGKPSLDTSWAAPKPPSRGGGSGRAAGQGAGGTAVEQRRSQLMQDARRLFESGGDAVTVAGTLKRIGAEASDLGLTEKDFPGFGEWAEKHGFQSRSSGLGDVLQAGKTALDIVDKPRAVLAAATGQAANLIKNQDASWDDLWADVGSNAGFGETLGRQGVLPEGDAFWERAVRGTLGFGADMILDPLNLIGVGLVNNAAKGATQTSKAFGRAAAQVLKEEGHVVAGQVIKDLSVSRKAQQLGEAAARVGRSGKQAASRADYELLSEVTGVDWTRNLGLHFTVPGTGAPSRVTRRVLRRDPGELRQVRLTDGGGAISRARGHMIRSARKGVVDSRLFGVAGGRNVNARRGLYSGDPLAAVQSSVIIAGRAEGTVKAAGWFTDVSDRFVRLAGRVKDNVPSDETGSWANKVWHDLDAGVPSSMSPDDFSEMSGFFETVRTSFNDVVGREVIPKRRNYVPRMKTEEFRAWLEDTGRVSRGRASRMDPGAKASFEQQANLVPGQQFLGIDIVDATVDPHGRSPAMQVFDHVGELYAEFGADVFKMFDDDVVSSTQALLFSMQRRMEHELTVNRLAEAGFVQAAFEKHVVDPLSTLAQNRFTGLRGVRTARQAEQRSRAATARSVEFLLTGHAPAHVDGLVTANLQGVDSFVGRVGSRLAGERQSLGSARPRVRSEVAGRVGKLEGERAGVLSKIRTELRRNPDADLSRLEAKLTSLEDELIGLHADIEVFGRKLPEIDTDVSRVEETLGSLIRREAASPADVRAEVAQLRLDAAELRAAGDSKGAAEFMVEANALQASAHEADVVLDGLRIERGLVTRAEQGLASGQQSFRDVQRTVASEFGEQAAAALPTVDNDGLLSVAGSKVWGWSVEEAAVAGRQGRAGRGMLGRLGLTFQPGAKRAVRAELAMSNPRVYAAGDGTVDTVGHVMGDMLRAGWDRKVLNPEVLAGGSKDLRNVWRNVARRLRGGMDFESAVEVSWLESGQRHLLDLGEGGLPVFQQVAGLVDSRLQQATKDSVAAAFWGRMGPEFDSLLFMEGGVWQVVTPTIDHVLPAGGLSPFNTSMERGLLDAHLYRSELTAGMDRWALEAERAIDDLGRSFQYQSGAMRDAEAAEKWNQVALANILDEQGFKTGWASPEETARFQREIALRSEASELRGKANEVFGKLRATDAADTDTLSRLTAEYEVFNLEAAAKQMEADLGVSKRLSDAEMLLFMRHPEYRRGVHSTLVDGFTQIGAQHVGPDGLAELFATTSQFSTPEGMGRFLKAYDWATNFFRMQALATPGFHERNYLGGMFNNWLGGVDRESYKQFRRANKAFKSGDLSQLSPEEARWITEIVDSGVTGGGRTQDVASLVGITEGATRDGSRLRDRAKRLVEPRLKSPQETLGRRASQAVLDNPVARANRKVGERVEHQLRGVAAWDALRKGGTLDDAIEQVTRFHFDYSDMSDFERNVLRRIVPFYTWTRNNLPLQIEMMARQPQKYTRALHAKRNIELLSDEEQTVAEYFFDGLTIRTPLNFAGGQYYSMLDLPYQDLFDLDVRGQLSQINPLLQIPYEYATGEKIFTGAPFASQSVVAPGAWTKIPGLMQGLNAVGRAHKRPDGQWVMRDQDISAVESLMPFFGRARRVAPTEDRYQDRWVSSMISMLFGLGGRVNTERDQMGELARLERILLDEIREGHARGTVPNLRVSEFPRISNVPQG